MPKWEHFSQCFLHDAKNLYCDFQQALPKFCVQGSAADWLHFRTSDRQRVFWRESCKQLLANDAHLDLRHEQPQSRMLRLAHSAPRSVLVGRRRRISLQREEWNSKSGRMISLSPPQSIQKTGRFLVACTRLYDPLCPSVGWSVGMSICLSVTLSFFFSSFYIILSHLK